MKNHSLKNYAEVALRNEILTPDYDRSGRSISKSKECIKLEHELLDRVGDRNADIVFDTVQSAISKSAVTREELNPNFINQLVNLGFVKAQAQGNMLERNFIVSINIYKNGKEVANTVAVKPFNNASVFSPHFNDSNSTMLVNRTMGKLNGVELRMTLLSQVSRHDFDRSIRREEVNTCMCSYEN